MKLKGAILFAAYGLAMYGVGLWMGLVHRDPGSIEYRFYLYHANVDQIELPPERKGANLQFMLWEGGQNWYGSDDYYARVRNGGFPPRCRNVREGHGCIDWFEEGETNWDTVLKRRPR